MSFIQILPPKVVKCIAAGESIQYPTSIVKELLENSLDANATSIYIDIECGGNKSICIRDNGHGINKSEMKIALARHATSKIRQFDDLKIIKSMGFRGEALSSISAISRLSLTSRPPNQNEAWKIYCEGGNTTDIFPTAHPIGTSIEVLDIFYNIPVKRKILRTDKTEFIHITTLVRCIALAWFNVTFILRHHKEVIHHYKLAKTEKEYLLRLNSLCGSTFTKNSISIYKKEEDIIIKGWIINPTVTITSNIQYIYINKRMVKDLLINHAVCQAFYHFSLKKPSYILYLDIDPNLIDINIHPNKKSIKFYQERVIHHLIYQAIFYSLKNSAIYFPIKSIRTEKETSDFIKWQLEQKQKLILPHSNSLLLEDQIQYQKNIKNLPENFLKMNNKRLGRILTILKPCYALIESFEKIYLFSLSKAESYLITMFLNSTYENNPYNSIHRLIIPIRIPLRIEEIKILKNHENLLKNMGFLITIDENGAQLKGLPSSIRQINNLQNFIIDFLKYIYSQSYDILLYNNKLLQKKAVNWIINWIESHTTHWNYFKAIDLFYKIERFFPNWIHTPPPNIIVTLNIESAIDSLRNNNDI
ncbi:DNA mismatch repair endonuclease MutL [Candidatus Schneideria nysicola]|uniref:DNA mismatch repair endonuclease MutL n=1 Tax=Candidatus Schneideria nysicola TaxID=1081631 RepID=UPI001CAA62EE|nr:DNA mismatch repair endonuclease MutL [Candidatus Schneideria nysicola]UAJ65038.1 DNA mismatch repair endonuclease MutL [Candidatus Schneideria nysicola]